MHGFETATWLLSVVRTASSNPKWSQLKPWMASPPVTLCADRYWMHLLVCLHTFISDAPLLLPTSQLWPIETLIVSIWLIVEWLAKRMHVLTVSPGWYSEHLPPPSILCTDVILNGLSLSWWSRIGPALSSFVVTSLFVRQYTRVTMSFTNGNYVIFSRRMNTTIWF